MLRIFIIAIEIGVLILLLRSPYVQYLFSDVQLGLSDWLTELSLAAERQELSELRESVEHVTGAMREYQQDYWHDVTSTKLKLINFNKLYCVNGDKNPYIYGSNLQVVCSAIQSSQLLD